MATNRQYRWVGFLCPLALMLMTVKVSHAQQAFEQPMDQNPESEQQSSGLPMQQDLNQPRISVPPPVVPNPQGYPLPGSTPYPGETVFQAPNGFQRGNLRGYMVYVNGDSPYLLQQVQTVEPRASIQPYQGRQVIQVGTYSDEASAKRQVEALRSQGVFAEVSGASASGYPYAPPSVASSSYPYPPGGVNSAYPYPPNGANPTSADAATNLPYPPPPPGGGVPNYTDQLGGSNITRSSPYLVVIPGGRQELSSLAQRAMRLGIRQDAIQQKDSPLGPHLEIGPFSAYKEARDVSNFLSGGGLDSRVYYSR